VTQVVMVVILVVIVTMIVNLNIMKGTGHIIPSIIIETAAGVGVTRA
jgi:hypothetical protein